MNQPDSKTTHSLLSSPSRPKISAFVVCFNEERNIRRCLSALTWCDEIVVIDSGSMDRTLEICKDFTDKVIFHPWEGFVRQKAFGLSQCTGDWVINVDADEEVSEELQKEIVDQITSAHSNMAGFEINRVVFFLNKWWRKGGWHPEYRLRVVKKAVTVWGGEDPHERAEVKGETLRLKGELRHYTYSSIADQIRALNNHSSASAETLKKKGKSASLFTIVGRPFMRFLKFYFLRRGYREGFPGFIVAINESYYVFLKYVKLWELSRRE